MRRKHSSIVVLALAIVSVWLVLLTILLLLTQPPAFAADGPAEQSIGAHASPSARLCLPIVLKRFSSPALTPWHKLRLHITTTSDWSSVQLTGGADVLVSGIIAANGGWQSRAGNRTVSLGQNIAAALSGESVTVTVDFALTNLASLVRFEITRGGLGETTVEVWNANGQIPTRVRTVRWSGQNPPSNAFPFTVDGSALTRGGPLISRAEDIADAEFNLSRQLDSQLPEWQLQFHRARIAFTTTSDWAELSLVQGAEVFDVRLLAVMGSPTRAEASGMPLALSQPLPQANAGARVGLTASLALDNVVPAGNVQFVISKGHLNDATVEVFNYNTATPVSVKRVTHSGIVSISDPRNPLTFTVGAGLLTANGPLEVKPAVGKMIWAFYYPWYSSWDWASPILRDRPAAPYRSDDPQALARHIEQAQSARIDGFISSWWGPGDYTDANLKLLLDAAAMRGFAIMVYFETLADTGPRDEGQIRQWLEYLIPKYGQHPAYYRLNGKPVIVIWASGTVPLATWQRIFSNLRAQGLDAVYIAMGYDPQTLSDFQGIHQYGVAGHFRLGALYQSTAKQVRGFSLLHPDAAPRIRIATLQPGYDDRNIPDRQGFYWERRDGDAYRYTFEAARKSNPDWLFITTWNEWWEHTYIEPSERYGDLYLRLTREFADAWKR